jgi:threonine/homoserine/homoserine lactone efflux protein
MFDYTTAHWAAFLSAAILLNLSPGPDIAFILTQTIRGGRRAGFVAMLGIWTGAFGHVLLAALGLSAILATSATAFSIIKWAGAGYLIWLGIQAWRTGEDHVGDSGDIRALCGREIFGQGLLVAALNPKVAVFFLAFLPQFVVTGAGPASAQLFLHGVLIIAIAAIVEPCLVILGSTTTRTLRHHPRIAVWMDRSLGTVLIGFGIRLIFAKHT